MMARSAQPTRTALMSSRYAYNLGLSHGVITNGHAVALRLNESTIAQHLKDMGYATHAFGKWDIGYHTWAHTPTRRGFDTWLGWVKHLRDDRTYHGTADGEMRFKPDPSLLFSLFLLFPQVYDTIRGHMLSLTRHFRRRSPESPRPVSQFR